MQTRLSLYRLSYRYHSVWMRIWKPLTAVVTVTLAVALLAWLVLKPIPAWVVLVGRAGAGLALLGLGLFLGWLLLSGWHGIAPREMVWWAVRLLGGLRQRILSGWGGLLLLILGVIVFMGVRAALLGQVQTPVEILSNDQLMQILAAMTLILLFYLIAQSRRRIVIDKFGNYLNDTTLDKPIEGLSSYLVDKLSSLAALYRNIDEALPQQASGVVEATVTALDTDGELKGLVEAGSKISLGPIAIPIDSLFSLVGRLVQGPRLTGSIHKDGETLVLLASLSGSHAGSWRVLSSDLDDPVPAEVGQRLYAMMEQMAYRIFTDLVSIGTNQWRAAFHYSHGLRQYRKTLQVESERTLRLRQAEQSFIKALAEDTQFARCHYNLGVVYQKLKQPDSAMAAFRQALAQASDHYDASYALALNLYSSSPKPGRFTEVIQLCDYAIRLRPADARAWNLKGLALRKDAEARQGNMALAYDDPTWQKVILPVRATAVALAWGQMCRWTLGGRSIDWLRDTVSWTLRNLAVAHTQIRQYFASQRLFSQALRFSPDDAELRLEFSRTLVEARQWKPVLRVLTRVYDHSLSSELNRATYWACLAAAHAALYGSNPKGQGWRARLVLESSHRFLDALMVADERVEDILALVKGEAVEAGYLKTSLEQAGLEDVARYFDHLEEFYYWLHNPRRGSSLPEGLASWEWAKAQAKIRSAGDALEYEAFGEAQNSLREAITALEPEHLYQIIRQRLYSSLAEAYQRDKKPVQALAYAVRAVEMNPESAQERVLLGQIYFDLKDYSRAEVEWTVGLKLRPDEHNLIRGMVEIHSMRGIAALQSEERNQAFERVIALLDNSLQTWQSLRPDERSADYQEVLNKHLTDTYGWPHFWLGHFHKELLHLDQAIAHLKISKEAGYRPLETRVALANAYLDAGLFSAAGDTFCEALHQAHAAKQRLKKDADWGEVELYARFEREAGEERPLIEWVVRALIGLAKTCAAQGVRLAWARRHLAYARAWLPRIQDRTTRVHDQVDYHDTRAWILLQEGNPHAALSELNQAVALDAGALTHFLFMQAYRQLIKKDAGLAAHWTEKNRQAALALRQADLRGKYRAETEAALGEVTTPAPVPVAPAIPVTTAAPPAALQIARATALIEPEVEKKH